MIGPGCMCGLSVVWLHEHSKDNGRPTCHAKSPTAQDMLQPIPDWPHQLASCSWGDQEMGTAILMHAFSGGWSYPCCAVGSAGVTGSGLCILMQNCAYSINQCTSEYQIMYRRYSLAMTLIFVRSSTLFLNWFTKHLGNTKQSQSIVPTSVSNNCKRIMCYNWNPKQINHIIPLHSYSTRPSNES